jgi:phosphate transport system permease protein
VTAAAGYTADLRRAGSVPAWAPWAAYGMGTALAVALSRATGINAALLVVAAILLTAAGIYLWSRALEGSRRATDRIATLAVTSTFAIALVPLVSLLVTVIRKGSERFDLDFFTNSLRNVVGEGGGAVHAIVGTLVITGLATFMAVPIGILTAVYLREYGAGRRLAAAVTFFVDVMTGIPSIVAGLFAYALFAIFLGPGVRLGVVGAVALTVLMIPIVVRATEEMLRIVPNSLREASYALGVPKWKTIVRVVLPTALGGIITGVMLAIARVVGETAPLLVTTGVITSTNWNPFEGRMMNLSVFAYFQYKTPGVPPEPYFARAWAAALTLIIIVLVLYFVARLVSLRWGRTEILK